VDALFECQPALFYFVSVQKQNIALIVNAPITITISIDSCVVLIVAANRAQPKRLWIVLMLVFIEAREHDEVGLAVGRLPDPLSGGAGQMKASGHFDPRVKSLTDR